MPQCGTVATLTVAVKRQKAPHAALCLNNVILQNSQGREIP